MSFTGFQLGLTDSLIEASKKVVENSAEYKKFFDGALKKFGVTSPAELTGDKKKEFFDYIDKNYNSDDEKGEDGVKEGTLPPALQKAIDKKNGKKSDDEDEDKKEVEEKKITEARYGKVKKNHYDVKVTVSDKDVDKVKEFIANSIQSSRGEIEDVDTDRVDGGGMKFKGTDDIFIQGDGAGELGLDLEKKFRNKIKVEGF